MESRWSQFSPANNGKRLNYSSDIHSYRSALFYLLARLFARRSGAEGAHQRDAYVTTSDRGRQAEAVHARCSLLAGRRFGAPRVQHRNHVLLPDPHERAIGHRCGACHAALLACQASLAKEIAGPQDGNDCFFTLSGNDRELDLAFLDVEDSVRSIVLRENSLWFFW